jgi:hypothetical protein
MLLAAVPICVCFVSRTEAAISVEHATYLSFAHSLRQSRPRLGPVAPVQCSAVCASREQMLDDRDGAGIGEGRRRKTIEIGRNRLQETRTKED